MKYRIVKKPYGDEFIIQKRVFFRWVNMSSSIFTTVEDAKRFLTHLVKMQYKKDIVYESNTKIELEKISMEMQAEKAKRTKEPAKQTDKKYTPPKSTKSKPKQPSSRKRKRY